MKIGGFNKGNGSRPIRCRQILPLILWFRLSLWGIQTPVLQRLGMAMQWSCSRLLHTAAFGKLTLARFVCPGLGHVFETHLHLLDASISRHEKGQDQGGLIGSFAEKRLPQVQQL